MKKVLHYLYWPINFFLLGYSQVKFSTFRIFGLIIISNKGNCRLGANLRINTSRWANVIGGNTRTTIVIKENASFIVGDNVSISNSAFYCSESIRIEDDVMIGGDCKIWDTDFHPLDPQLRREDPNKNFKTKPIHIKSSAFVGGGSTILKGVIIGENSIVGAGSVVRTSIPANEIWAGNPAKFIRKI
jgi:acetyltransferase-like isoleucine patch superfamily enzyme